MATKKDFTKNNPALAFMSMGGEEAKKQDTSDQTAPEGYKVNPLYIETKSMRVNLLMQPSIVERMKKIATAKGLSLNEAINEAVRQYLEREEA